ncbi:sporulation protein rmd1 [Lichtheimia corymbifera JMRC:FSU:9682]|uniref:Sporulation protein rmd1 n=1 Tax=Lichtheimia corymbifera JMRC:FSU:9682 TaxID=1263082 RepID=A0A068RH53_9FUNG|nr:sporulation protein rmd1 [Lichtheimia corymbifera JMRC:FSU:9682]
MVKKGEASSSTSSKPPSAIAKEVLKPQAQQPASAITTPTDATLLNVPKTKATHPGMPPRSKSTQPVRSTKLTQKLVLFPPKSVDPSVGMEHVLDAMAHDGEASAVSPSDEQQPLHAPAVPRTAAEHMTQDERDLANLSRVTAYCTGEGYNVTSLRAFLRQHHHVSPRLYDECLYAAYHYPLWTLRPGKENLLNVRIRSASPHPGMDHEEDEEEMNYEEDSYQDEDDNSSNKTRRKSDKDSSSLFLGGELFVFDYGVVVFWNFHRAQELLMLEDLSQFSIRPFRDNPNEDMQIEEMHFQYDTSQIKPRIFNDMITLKSSNHMIKLTLSHGLSQSAVLARYEDIMDKTIEDTKHLPKEMAQTGRLVKNRTEITKINGHLFQLRMNVNLVSNVLDTPEIFWSEPALQPMYVAIRDYLEIPQRAKILNDRLKVVSDLLSMLRDHLTNFGVEYQTLIIIYLIIVAVIVACFEIGVKALQSLRVM